MTKRQMVVERLQMLVDLCYNTIPDETDNCLFHEHMIDAEKLLDQARDKERWVELYPDERAVVMANANRIWKIRNKIKKGELPKDYLSDMADVIESYIKQGQKINAIKLYRKKHDCTLREAKDYIDGVEMDLKNRGIM